MWGYSPETLHYLAWSEDLSVCTSCGMSGPPCSRLEFFGYANMTGANMTGANMTGSNLN